MFLLDDTTPEWNCEMPDTRLERLNAKRSKPVADNSKYKSFGRPAPERDREAYKGYMILKGLDGFFRVVKDDTLITTQPSSDAAKAVVDLLV